ncbi:MAG: DUF1549 and DUF1553 domain-containing protein [Planctomycetaceae bacterium]|nr:DUF1549 and DUF1553 domain-containing protein [Planctomycetaceae bacterium]
MMNHYLATLLLLNAITASAADVRVAPERVVFTDAFARRQLLVTADGRDATRRAGYVSRSPGVVEIDDRGYAVPKGNGVAEIEVRLADRMVTVPVEVRGLDQVRPVDFATEIEPLLSRFGCNSGGCHGKATGQNGFKLSLFGFDTEFDYAALVKEGRGRRVFAPSPDKSLLLAKASGRAPHGGGKRIDVGSEPYRLLQSWLQAGAPPSAPNSPRVVKLRLTPAEQILSPNDVQQLVVFAEYSDGSQRDVTREAQYSSNLDVVAVVADDGLVAANEPTGEAAIMARYMGQVAVCTILRPQGSPLAALPEFQPAGYVDELSAAKWMKLGLRPSPVCDDATYLRRLTVDLCGRLPTVDETREFLAKPQAASREELVDRLLKSPDYPAYFALKWGSILRNSNLAGADRTAYAFHNWIKDQIARNRPYDEFVRGIVAASGEWQDAPAINWLWQSRDDQLHQVTADTAQVFLGLRLQCAKCHHHPYERFSQDDYYGLAGFFTRLGRKSFGEPPPYYSAPNVTIGERHPITGEQIEPKYLDGDVIKFGPEEDPRHALVDWMARPDNPYFARALVNRMWGHFFGRGLVHEVDDLRETNPASNPELLVRLSQDFVEHKFDVQHLIRQLVTSRVYQLSSLPTSDNANDRQNFARYYPRRFPAEVMLDAVDQTCGVKSNFGNMSSDARAIDLPHENFGSYFLDAFDRPRRVTGCECERSTGATLSQVLLLANSDELENKLADGNGRIERLIKGQVSTPRIIEELYLAAFTRYPTAQEVIAAEAHLARDSNVRQGLEDVLWSLVNSRGFGFNH